MSLCLLTMFKNESHIMKEFITHYLKQGVDHFIMIDNGSNDNYLEMFLMKLPNKDTYGVDPNADNKALMVNLWEQYILTSGKDGKIIYPNLIDDKYDGLLKFNVNDTEVSDLVMGGGWTLFADYYKKVNLKKVDNKTKLSDFFAMKPTR